MGRKSNDVESYKRKTKKDKARRKKELFGKYRLTKEGDTLASQKPKKDFFKKITKPEKSKKNENKKKTKVKTK